MSAVFDKDTNSIYVSAYDLCQYIFRGGDINSRLVSGNKYGSTITGNKLAMTKGSAAPAPKIPLPFIFHTNIAKMIGCSS